MVEVRRDGCWEGWNGGALGRTGTGDFRAPSSTQRDSRRAFPGLSQPQLSQGGGSERKPRQGSLLNVFLVPNPAFPSCHLPGGDSPEAVLTKSFQRCFSQQCPEAEECAGDAFQKKGRVTGKMLLARERARQGKGESIIQVPRGC